LEAEVNLNGLEYLPYFITNNGEVESIGYAFINLTQYSKEELVGKKISEVFKMLRIFVYDSVESVEHMEEKSNGYLFTKALECRQIIMIRRPGPNHSSMVYIFLEKPDSRLEDKFPVIHQMCESGIFGIAIFSVPGLTLLKANQTWLDLMDEPYNKKENSLGRYIGDIVTNWKGSRLESIWNNVLKTGEAYYNREYQLESIKGGTVYKSFSITPIYEHGQLRFFVEISSDITDVVLERQQMKERIIVVEQQKNEIEKTLKMKEEFFSFMSHEFKTPLTIINTAVQALENICGNELSKKAKVFVKKIRQNSFRQLRLINNLLDITRSDAGFIKINKRNADIVSMTKVITESVALYARQKGIILKFSSELDKKIIAIDDEKYERILLNLLSNAFKFTPINKSVSVHIFSDEQNICVQVRDEGIGIPKEKQDVIFDLFGQVNSSLVRNTEGTGIGLSLVKILVEAMGGSIGLESEEGVGSVFSILLPDVVAEENDEQLMMEGVNDYRLVNAIDIEFSDIYSS